MKIALIQSSLVWGNVDENLKNFENKLAECRAVDLILLPEMFISGSMMVKKSHEIAMAEHKRVALRFEEIRQKMQEWAKKCDAAIAGSTVCEENKEYYNRLVIAFPDDKYLYYDKRHCFRQGGENEYFSAGSEQLIFDFRGVKIAAFICYDLRFPVWIRNTQQYDLAFFVANWPESRREVWKTLLKARAIENQAYIAGVNCVGTDENGISYAGDSMVADAYGQVIVETAESREEVIVVECNIKQLHEFRRKFPVLEDRDGFDIQY